MECTFKAKKKQHLFLGRVKTLFFNAYTKHDVETIEIDCLQEKLGITDTIFQEYTNRNKDVGVFPLKDVICGPVTANFLGGNKWDIFQYQQIRSLFETLKTVDRTVAFLKFICKEG